MLMVKANPKPTAESYCLRLGQQFCTAYAAAHPETIITELDLYRDHIPLIDSEIMSAWGKLAKREDLTYSEQNKLDRLNEIVEQFMQNDTIVFVAPMWNFGYPPMMKAYMDAIAIAGKTFKYTVQGPVGLVTGKRAVVLEARGGLWSEGAGCQLEHSFSHLRGFLAFLGITDVTPVFAENLNVDPGRAEEIFAVAARQARQLAHHL
ncbi:NAD(P)H-dependent oxidoreductase [Deinococcus sp. QL22]|uniref:NAD(P)H-dependent oxidoreductase n=1 Tax=Deinococcus sp. QL22 TaxID=2939437 RepID=UPI0020172894|nr:NAD(P)H-dependent oxidoreductase [Deinococcus sp. QL22]UQN09514.1 NAD(P)H-dependent oxidoreductase [Deinococcus sp. QL22]